MTKKKFVRYKWVKNPRTGMWVKIGYLSNGQARIIGVSERKGGSTKKKRKKKLDTLGKVMSKIARGLKLTPAERKILAGAIDGAKKAKSEYG